MGSGAPGYNPSLRLPPKEIFFVEEVGAESIAFKYGFSDSEMDSLFRGHATILAIHFI